MLENSQTAPHQHNEPLKTHPHHEVEITINGEPYHIRQGEHTVGEIKTLGGVPQADVLEEVVHGKLKPLPDDGTVKIKGKEVFISHVRDCGSS